MSRFKNTRRAIERLIWDIETVVSGKGKRLVPVWLRDGTQTKERSAYKDLFQLHASINVGREFLRDLGVESNTVAKIIIFAPVVAFAIYWFEFR
jgi:hypothetical protein